MSVISLVSSGSIGQRFGTGIDGDITVTGVGVDIKAIYETVGFLAGVNTKNGINQGLGYGAGTYNPKLNQTNNTAQGVPNCINFTINLGASLTCTAWGAGADDKLGVIWIACIGKITINGTISGANKGGAGGAGGVSIGFQGADGFVGIGVGHGHGGDWDILTPAGGLGGISYGSSDIPTTTWGNLYGSGGGGGAAAGVGPNPGGPGGGGAGASIGGANGANTGGSGANNPGGAGGYGGGAVRLYTLNLDINATGLITVAGQNGTNAPLGGDGGGGGGGSGGTVYIETIQGAKLGTNLITAILGAGGTAAGVGGAGGTGRDGRIHIVGNYIGSTTTPPIA